MTAPVRITVETSDGVRMTLKGREAFAIDALVAAGERGCTPIEHPGPRWSDYVFKLRKRGLVVETVDERHSGPYAGSHARYVLRTPLTVVDEVRLVADGAP